MPLSKCILGTKHQINICLWTKERPNMLTSNFNSIPEMQDNLPRLQSIPPNLLSVVLKSYYVKYFFRLQGKYHHWAI